MNITFHRIFLSLPMPITQRMILYGNQIINKWKRKKHLHISKSFIIFVLEIKENYYEFRKSI